MKNLKGTVQIPADKSISHRAVMFASLAKGKSVIKNFSNAQDPHSSLEICKALGIEIEHSDSMLIINSEGKFNPKQNIFNCNNSGTTMRLMAGILSGQNFNSTLIGDQSLSARPMKRIIEPLSLMGAKIQSQNFQAPLVITGKNLHGIDYSSTIASAQVKSCILLAGLFAEGKTYFSEPYTSRNHTELMLSSMGAKIDSFKNKISIEKSELQPININICGDISSAAYFIAGALITPNSDIILKNIGLNQTRTGILDVVNKMGANIEILDIKEICKEPVGDLRIKYSPDLKGCKISGQIIPRLIDEIPVIALIASQAKGQTIIKDAQDLRNKESDRIKTTVEELKKLGVDIEETNDGMIINGKCELFGGVETNSHKDHRLAMTLYTASLITKKEIFIQDFDWIKISFPNFVELFEKLLYN